MNIGPMELVLLVGIALLLFGPSKLPQLGKSLGEGIRGFKKAMSDTEKEPPARVTPSAAPDTTNAAVDEAMKKSRDKDPVS